MSRKAEGLLRQIAIHVEEPRSGTFKWVLREFAGEDGAWNVLQRSPRTARTYKAAMADGLLALEALINDLEIGPRSEDPGKDAAPSAMNDDEAATPPPSKAKRAKSQVKAAGRTAFGFGVME